MKKISVLLVEDEPDVLRMLSIVLSRLYNTVITAANGQEGLEKFKASSPDIVISDIQMPIMNGISMAGEIRKIDSKTPIILVSAFNDPENLLKAINTGVDRFVPKPVDIAVLKKILEKVDETIEARKINKNLEEKMSILTQAILNSSDVVCIFSLTGELIFFNDSFIRCFGQTVNEILKSGSDSIFAGNPEINSMIKDGKVSQKDIELEVSISCGKPKFFRLSTTPIFKTSGEPLGSLLVFHDISDKVESAKLLDQKMSQVLQSTQRKAEFLSTVSHDIRTPIGLILGLTDSLLEENLPQDHKKQLNLIQDSAKNLLHLVNDILDISKIEEGKLIIENIPFAIREILDYLKNLFLEKAKEKKIDFSIKYDDSLKNIYQGDPFRLQQILINLLGNSFKFTSAGHITILARELSSSKNNAILEFTVSDSGKGIHKDRLDSIFNRYEQEESSTARNYGGTGLGTAIAKNLTELMGGMISVISPAVKIPGNAETPGSEFTFTIKVQNQETPLMPDPEKNENAIELLIEKIRKQKLSILVAEDNPVNQLLLKKILNLYDATVDIAHDGDEAFDKGVNNAYNVIFMDIEMPGMGGMEVTEKLRANHIQTPIVACTAHSFKEDLEKYLVSGMNGYLVKPVNKKSVIDSLFSVINFEK